VDNWVECHQEQLRQAYQKAGECLELEREERKMQYDRKIGSSDILIGQHVHLRNHVVGDTRSKMLLSHRFSG